MGKHRELRSLHLFAGAGGGVLADLILGHRPVCAVEIEDYPRRVLLARQADGSLPWFPIWDDVRTFDGRPWRGLVDIVAGGFPCQDISVAGKGTGIHGEKSGLWSEMAKIILVVRPRYVFVENSPMLTSRGLCVVLGDLAKMGYNARWCVLGSEHVGACHRRNRIFILAMPSPNDNKDANIGKSKPEKATCNSGEQKWICPKDEQKWEGWLGNLASMGYTERISSYTEARRTFYGLANGLDRLHCLGNGQMPQQAALAWKMLLGVVR